MVDAMRYPERKWETALLRLFLTIKEVKGRFSGINFLFVRPKDYSYTECFMRTLQSVSHLKYTLQDLAFICSSSGRMFSFPYSVTINAVLIENSSCIVLQFYWWVIGIEPNPRESPLKLSVLQ